jgi:hypothetical protein
MTVIPVFFPVITHRNKWPGLRILITLSGRLLVLYEKLACLCFDVSNVFQRSVDALYDFRDHYFETHTLDKANLKLSDVKNELDRVLADFENIPGKQ